MPYALIIVLWIIYAALSIFSPGTSIIQFLPSNISPLALRLSILLPALLVWLAALDGTLAFKRYSDQVKRTPESRAVSLITKGLFWILGYIIVISIVTAATPYLLHTAYADATLIARDHIPAITALIAFLLLYQGSHQLKLIANFTTWTATTIWAFMGYLIFSAVSVLLFITFGASGTEGNLRNSIEALPQGTLIFTLMLPYLFAWFLGLLATVNISRYARQVKGVLYRQAIKNLVRGIRGIVVFAIMFQAFTFTIRFFTELHLTPLLVPAYLLVVLYAIGFLLIRSGAKKLSRIEAAQ